MPKVGRGLWLGLSLVLALAACEAAPKEAAISLTRVSDDPLVHGRRVADVLGCTGCHGADLTGRDWSEPGFGQLWTSNLSRVTTRYSDIELEQAIRGGMRPDGSELWGMPSHIFTHLSDSDMGAVIAFLRSVTPAGTDHPRPVFEAGARAEIASGLLKSAPAEVREQGETWPPDLGAEHGLGRYIARATCAECHGVDLRGGTPYPGASPRPDLRMVAAYEPEAFQRLLRTGVAAGDRELGLMSEVSRGRFSKLTDPEVEALYRYLAGIGAAEAQ